MSIRSITSIASILCHARVARASAFVVLLASSVGATDVDLSGNGIRIKASYTPDVIDPARDTVLTLTVDAPEAITVTLPSLQDRFSGFATAEDFAVDPITANGIMRSVYQWKLTPEAAAPRYRLAPFAVSCVDTTRATNNVTTYATPPILFPPPAARAPVTGEIESDFRPDYIYPTMKTFSLWVLATLAGIALVIAALFGLRHISRRIKEHRMSPQERALAELSRLLARNLPIRGLYKDFYVELTMVVRRYIERMYGIHAPKLTTQEFLATSQQLVTDANMAVDFDALRSFLESADLIKFAGVEATPRMADNAVDAARSFVATRPSATAAENRSQS